MPRLASCIFRTHFENKKYNKKNPEQKYFILILANTLTEARAIV